MFSGLRVGSVFYVLHKENKPTLKTGQVQGVTTPRPRYNQYQPTNPMQFGQEQVVDVSVRYSDGSTENFNMLPSTSNIANFGDKGVVVAESRDAMIAEVEGMRHTSQDIIDSMDYHKGVVAAAEEILASIDPTSAKEKATEQRIGAMEQRMGGIEGSIDELKGMLSKALDRTSTGSYKNK